MNKKISIAFAFFIILASTGITWWLLKTSARDIPKAETPLIKIAEYYWPGDFWIDIAAEKGWFKKAGLKVELVDTNADYFQSLEDTVEGSIDVNSFSLFDLMSFNARGGNLAMIANTDSSFGAESIVAKPYIHSIGELKGKKIGVTTNTYTDYILYTALQRNGLSESDVERIDMPTEKTAEEFINGNVEAIIAWEPFISQAMTKAQGKKIFDTSRIPGISPGGIVVRRNFIETYPDEVQKLLMIWNQATSFIKNNPDLALEIIAKKHQKTRQEIEEFMKIDTILNLRDNLSTFSYAAGFESIYGAARKINKFLKEYGQIEEELDSNEFIETTFIRKLRKTRT